VSVSLVNEAARPSGAQSHPASHNPPAFTNRCRDRDNVNRMLIYTKLYCISTVALLLNATIASSVENFKYYPVRREIVEARLEMYKGNNRQREATLKQLFTEAGCDEQHLSEQAVKESKLPNVVCMLPGSSGKVIIVGAHYDSVPDGDGVVDNWSGASLLPSLYQGLKAKPRTHTYVFVGFTDEEKGLVGSHFYARNMTKEEVAATDAMINMDTLGLAPTEVWVSHADKQLTGELVYLAKHLNMPASGVNVDGVGSTDSVEFADRKIPSITIHSLTQETWNARILHSAKDKLSAMNLDDYYQTYKLLMAYLVFLDEVAGLTPPTSSAR
jgi:hypothetical protein